MLDKIKRVMVTLVTTHIGRILLSCGLILFGGIMTPFGIIGELIYDYDEGLVWKILFYTGVVIFLGQGLMMIIYGLFIRPIKNLIDKRKKK